MLIDKGIKTLASYNNLQNNTNIEEHKKGENKIRSHVYYARESWQHGFIPSVRPIVYTKPSRIVDSIVVFSNFSGVTDIWCIFREKHAFLNLTGAVWAATTTVQDCESYSLLSPTLRELNGWLPSFWSEAALPKNSKRIKFSLLKNFAGFKFYLMWTFYQTYLTKRAWRHQLTGRYTFLVSFCLREDKSCESFPKSFNEKKH